jgi:acyl-coenzyme A thioesterase PaaI-like protein
MDDPQASDTLDKEAALREAIDGVRRLIELTVTAEPSSDALATAAHHVAQAAAALEPFRRATRRREGPAAPADREPENLMPFDPVVGRFSPLAPPLRVRWEPPKALGEVTFAPPYEGPPGCVHGGIIAAAFDQVFNVANLMLGSPGPTASLQLHYRRPTPLGVPLRFEGWQERVDGRRVHVRGRLLAGERVTVDAEGVFVVVPVERILAMLAHGSDGERDH